MRPSTQRPRSCTSSSTLVDGVLRVLVGDDGVGGADPTRGSGLVGLKDRVEAIGGRLTVQSRPGDGTRLVVELPADLDEQPRSG